VPGPDDLQKAIDTYGKPDVSERENLIERERAGVFADYPLSEWAGMELERYALGTDGDSFCRRMEFHTPYLGGIKGGSSIKHIIYRRRSDGSWYRAGSLADLPVDMAWRRLREQFNDAFLAVDRHRFQDLDHMPLLRHGQSLVTKALTTYFPDALLPIFSATHLRYYIRLFGAEPMRNGLSWQLNLQLKDLVNAHRPLWGWTDLEVTRLLYDHLDPRDTIEHAVKIAPPGRDGEYWEECLKEGVIRVGWDEVGDLAYFPTSEDLASALQREYRYQTPHTSKSTATQLIRYFRDLPAGSRVVANLGRSQILAVGTVTDAGYHYDRSKRDHRHTVKVDWDTTYAQQLDQPVRTWSNTIAPVTTALWNKIQAKVTLEVALPKNVENVIRGLQRKKQVVLYGPPGTGKTRLARMAAEAFAGNNVTHTTFHPSYGYEDFVEGYKPKKTNDGLALERTDGLFLDVCQKAVEKPQHNHVLVIDEINRADLARVLGELVTYLERDKRGHEFVLSTTKTKLSIPANVYLIGTMNTADRSVAHLDAAIRRRFEFQELRTDHEVVAGEVGPLDLQVLLEVLNERVREHLGPDFEIGHSYFLHDDEPLDNETDVHAAFFRDVVPLLEDYTINDQKLLSAILGRALGHGPDMSPDDLVTLLAEEFGAEADTNGAV
jgi:5-methylcytosine-specific restriction enzyme B